MKPNLNNIIHYEILNLPKRYNVFHHLQKLNNDPLELANAEFLKNQYVFDNPHTIDEIAIVMDKGVPLYTEDLNLCKAVIDKLKASMHDFGMMLTYWPEDGWRAAVGNIHLVEEGVHATNPAHALCMALCIYYGKV